MKLSGLSILSVVCALSLSTASYANIAVSQMGGLDICAASTGTWNGTGEIHGKIGPTNLDCIYRGTSVITPVSNGKFKMNVSFEKDSGSKICPAHQALALDGMCNDGQVKIDTNLAELSGSISSDAKSGTLKGFVKFAGLKFDTKIDLSRETH